MAKTAGVAFSVFKALFVDLASSQTSTARSSRDYLVDQLKSLAIKDKNFPTITNTFVPFGSFARRTKIEPLDDIDMLMVIDGTGTSERYSNSGYEYWLWVARADAPLARFPDGSGFVNSTKVLNQIKSSLQSVPNYRNADVVKNLNAVTLELSYPWSFDIVPAVEITDWAGNVTHFLIPDGTGDWIRTNPAKDGDYITRVNRWHDGNLLPVLRILKYWNRRTHKPRLMPYYFETLVLEVFDYAPKISLYREAIKYFFQNGPIYLMSGCADPKGLGAPLDSGVDWSTKEKVRSAMNDAAQSSAYALMYEGMDKQKEAIYWWTQVFGSEFPSYD